MSDEVRETQAGGGDRESGEAAGAKLRAATVNENQEEQITKPAPKVKTAERKRSQESRRWEKASRKKQTSKSSTRARNKT